MGQLIDLQAACAQNSPMNASAIPTNAVEQYTHHEEISLLHGNHKLTLYSRLVLQEARFAEAITVCENISN